MIGRGSVARTILLGAAVLTAACASAVPPPPGGDAGNEALRARIDRIVERPPFDQVHWGILAVEADRDRVLYARNPARKFTPASNMKLLVAAAGIGLLGADYRYRTELWATGDLDVDSGELKGNLVLPGSGDPTLSARFHGSDTAALRGLADSLRAAGVRTVTGDLVVDASRWDSTSVRGTWMVEDLPWSWGATGGAFAIAEGVLSVEVTGGDEPGTPARIRWWPAADAGYVESRLRTVAADSAPRIDPAYLPETGRILLRGAVPRKHVDTVEIASRRPVRLGGALLVEALRARGIGVEGRLRVVWDPEEELAPACPGPWLPDCSAARRIAGVTSPPLEEIVREILQPSQNWMAEQLVRTLGLELGGRGGWQEGIELERDFLEHVVGVDTLDLEIRDGSGLSAHNLATPRALVQVLRFMRRSEHAATFRAALAGPGEKESTLEDRLPELTGRLQAKTGTITHVNALSGYLRRSDGEDVLFSILTDGSGLPAERVRSAIDDVVRALSDP